MDDTDRELVKLLAEVRADSALHPMPAPPEIDSDDILGGLPARLKWGQERLSENCTRTRRIERLLPTAILSILELREETRIVHDRQNNITKLLWALVSMGLTILAVIIQQALTGG